jgi:rare lipoprotein A
MNPGSQVIALAATVAALSFSPAAQAEPSSARADKPAPAKLDRSGRKQVGQASFYAPKFNGRTMADGTPMNPRGNNAASKTLPLGTTARVTHLETGKSAVVTIQDRGPFVAGRIVDLSPATAEQIGLSKEDGLAPVEVTPIRLPEPSVASRSPDGER